METTVAKECITQQVEAAVETNGKCSTFRVTRPVWAGVTWEALRHDAEGDPGPDLVRVVGAGDETEERGERVRRGVRDTPLLGACEKKTHDALFT